MIIKDEIQIGGVIWKIQFEDKLLGSDDYPAKGITDLDECIITFDTALKGDILEENFWHEILHVVLDRSGYRPGHEMNHDHVLIESAVPTLHQIMNQVLEWQKEKK